MALFSTKKNSNIFCKINNKCLFYLPTVRTWSKASPVNRTFEDVYTALCFKFNSLSSIEESRHLIFVKYYFEKLFFFWHKQLKMSFKSKLKIQRVFVQEQKWVLSFHSHCIYSRNHCSKNYQLFFIVCLITLSLLLTFNLVSSYCVYLF